MCPGYCVCDTFQNFRRATCQNKKLYSIDLDIPNQAQLLDLSSNQISELVMNVFLELNLSGLKLLNLSHNRVSQIDMYGFEGLGNLKSLDLSFNMLQYLNQQWFVSLGLLQELYLRSNNFKSINHEPKFNLKYLRVLDIGLCNIENLNQDTFKYLPNLEVLDISDNVLVHLKVETIRAIPNLKSLIVKGISYKDPCGTQRKNHRNDMFQRMISSDHPVPKNNVWLYEDEPIVKTVMKECPKGKPNQTENVVDKMLLEVIDLSPSVVILGTLISGIFIGIILGCTCQLRTKPEREKLVDFESPTFVGAGSFRRQNSSGSTFRPRTRSTCSRKIIREDRNVLLMHESKLSHSTPLLTRKAVS
ncbi:hypothetical protein JTB14_016826 [Gonioctena quinquepunctata]|nr:hypothetical protein JTB14_016826 [Gonioctena quinquepunctata]